ncbi:predicted protein [Botrytis cinerea T4]|uniref:Uncharacterized protein n=1 Tax=Botryotinia fuckeliana (strain T4) TaxID=999810 RepID=G2YF71_BOTF4|nr:predicted protein [Botrytis cinerea T4]
MAWLYIDFLILDYYVTETHTRNEIPDHIDKPSTPKLLKTFHHDTYSTTS